MKTDRKEYQREWQRRRRAANPEKELAYKREYRLKNAKRLKAYDRDRGPLYRAKNRIELREYHRLWRLENPERIAGYTRNFRTKFPEKAKAYSAISKAIQRNRLKRQPCQVCGEFPTHAHHEDYSRPLDVDWLCTAHHHLVHRKLLTKSSDTHTQIPSVPPHMNKNLHQPPPVGNNEQTGSAS